MAHYYFLTATNEYSFDNISWHSLTEMPGIIRTATTVTVVPGKYVPFTIVPAVDVVHIDGNTIANPYTAVSLVTALQTLFPELSADDNSKSQIRSLDYIVAYRENVPMLGYATYTGTLTSVGQSLIAFSFLSGGTYNIPVTGWPYIKSIDLYCDRDIDISMREDNVANNMFYGVNDNIGPNSYPRINSRIFLKAGVVRTINTQFMRMGYVSSLTIVNFSPVDTVNTYNLRINVTFYSITKNTDLNGLSWIAMGDSITAGSGSTVIEASSNAAPSAEFFLFQVKRSLLLNKGKSFWLTNKGESSMTSSSIVQAINWGYYSIDKADFITCMIGANDANNLGTTGNFGLHISANQTIFQNNIDYILNWKQKRYPNAKLIMWGSTPSSDNTTETRIEIGRQIMAARVTNLNDANVKYCSLATAFDRTNSANYLASDTIHPVAQNSIASAMYTFINSLNWF